MEVALIEFARELASLDERVLAREELRDEEFLHLLRDLIVFSGRTPAEADRERLRRVLIHGLRECHAPVRTRLFFDLATRLGSADVALLASLEKPQGESALANTIDVTGLALLEREGVAAHGALTALGAQFLTFTQGRLGAARAGPWLPTAPARRRSGLNLQGAYPLRRARIRVAIAV